MRQARIRGEGKSYYHCMSRVVDGRFILGDIEKEHFVSLMWKLEAFHGMRVVTYCIMSNHFHLLIEEPDADLRSIVSADTIVERVKRLHDSDFARTLEEELERARSANDQEWESKILDRYRRRMGDLACFMKELKQRFSQWYNRRSGRRGTLWEDRYKSVLVEGDGQALMTMAAYIDLNPVRANMVSRVEDYRWSGYASAVGGNRWARCGLGRILTVAGQVSGDEYERRWGETESLYRLWLYHQGECRVAVESGERTMKNGFSEEFVEGEGARGGHLSLKEALRCRVRYLSEGAVLGSEKFVNQVFEANRAKFGKTRKSGARTMSEANWGSLRVLRDLQGEVVVSLRE